MIKFLFKIGIVLLFVIALTSCEKEYLNINDSEVEEESIITESDEGLILGKQLEDPYSLTNYGAGIFKFKINQSKNT